MLQRQNELQVLVMGKIGDPKGLSMISKSCGIISKRTAHDRATELASDIQHVVQYGCSTENVYLDTYFGTIPSCCLPNAEIGQLGRLPTSTRLANVDRKFCLMLQEGITIEVTVILESLGPTFRSRIQTKKHDTPCVLVIQRDGFRRKV